VQGWSAQPFAAAEEYGSFTQSQWAPCVTLLPLFVDYVSHG